MGEKTYLPIYSPTKFFGIKLPANFPPYMLSPPVPENNDRMCQCSSNQNSSTNSVLQHRHCRQQPYSQPGHQINVQEIMREDTSSHQTLIINAMLGERKSSMQER